MKIDMHCHSYYSNDSFCSPKSLVKAAYRKGLSGIAITDHNTTKAWTEGEEEAKKLNMIFVRGEEIKIKEKDKTIGEILAYFINKPISPENKTPEMIIKEIKNQNGLCILSHPFSNKKPFTKIEECLNKIDGIEIFNSRSQSEEGNKKAQEFTKNNNLSFTAGSDAHTLFEVGNAYIESDANSIEALKKDIINKKIKVIGKQSPLFFQIFSPLSKTMHHFKSLP
jgi:hypothetical protein